MTPKRIQRRRTKGWRMPDGAVYVGRPGKWGNPWTPQGYWRAGWPAGSLEVATAACVEQYRAWVTQTRSSWSGDIPTLPGRQPPNVRELRGKDLACWCPIGQACHAGVLLELANT